MKLYIRLTALRTLVDLHTRISHVHPASPGTPGPRDGSIDVMLYFALSCEAAFGCGLSTSITEAVMC